VGRWAVHSSAWGVVGASAPVSVAVAAYVHGRHAMKVTYTMGAMRLSRRYHPRASPPLRVSSQPPPPCVRFRYLVAKVVLRVDRGEATDGGDVSPGGVVGHLPSGIHLVHEPLPRPVHTHLEAGGLWLWSRDRYLGNAFLGY
jgi:hypothetical protein